MKMDAKKRLSRLLIGFVLVSIGFALGKETARRSVGCSSAPRVELGGTSGAMTASQPGTQPAGPDRVIVYYMHATFRCVTCNRIETLTDSLVRTDFGSELADGRLEWKQVNFQENEGLAERYGVGASCVVVVKVRGGKEVAFRRLDEVWTKVGEPGEFTRYVARAIREMLGGGRA